MNLETHGFRIISPELPLGLLDSLREKIFATGSAGERCLLDQPDVRTAASALKEQLISNGALPTNSVAIQAIAFDKTVGTNWNVSWHQDLMFPFAHPVSAPDFELPCTKQGIAYARPPTKILNRLLAVRLHLDDCDQTNGPLRVSPGSHRNGILDSGRIAETIAHHDEVAAIAKEGEVLLMRPLLLHASSKATSPRHRRVLHLVYDTGATIDESWHRAI